MKKKKKLDVIHNYQFWVTLIFTVGLFLMIPYYTIIIYAQQDMVDWQWYYAVLWIIILLIVGFKLRGKIPSRQKVKAKKSHFIYWILLGIFSVGWYVGEPGNITHLRSLNIVFIVYTIFIADSFWDFKKI